MSINNESIVNKSIKKLELLEIMKDNANDGIFLINNEYKIQEGYSKVLNTIFESSDLEDINFLDILKTNSSEEELTEYKGYLSLIFDKKRNLTKEQILRMNPLKRKKISFKEIGKPNRDKYLKFVFSNRIQFDDQDYACISVYDITKEIENIKEAEEKEEYKGNELKQIAILFHIGDLNVIEDYIFDSEYNIENINSILKNRKIQDIYKLSRIAGIIHAMKSDAMQLKLEDNAKRLEIIEDDIIKMLKNKNTDYDMITSILLKINNIKSEIGYMSKLKNILLEFKYQNKSVLSNFFNRIQAILDNNAHTLNKKIKLLNMEDSSLVEEDAIFVKSFKFDNENRFYQKLIKDFILQAVRNSIYHGIDRSDDRISKGKPETGTIKIIAKKTSNFIKIVVQDDGVGLDLIKIVEKAKKIPELLSILKSKKKLKEEDIINILCSDGFSTASNAGILAGKGLGLSYIREKIDEFEGKLNIRSKKDKGFAIIMTLPTKLIDTSTIKKGEIPDKSNKIWKMLVTGKLFIKTNNVSIGFLLTRIKKDIQINNSEENILKHIDEIYDFFTKYKKIFNLSEIIGY